jgi:hypothetical protein
MGLPPELDRLGAALTHAAARQHTRAERRRRLAGSIAAGLFVFAAMSPTPLDRADQPVRLPNFLNFAITSNASAAALCDQPRGPRFDEAACDDATAPQALR